jgi:hypothetical protein
MSTPTVFSRDNVAGKIKRGEGRIDVPGITVNAKHVAGSCHVM